MGPAREALQALLRPSSVAIVGASPRSYVGRVLCENLRTLGYEGAVYPVNPRYEEVLGWPCYASVEDLPDGPDAVVAAVGIDLVPEVLRAAGKRGARAAVVPGGGFTETGPAAIRVQQEISAAADDFGMAVAGPNCMGVIAPPNRSAMYIGTIPPSLLSGRVAVVSQSGSVVEAMVNMGPRVGFSALVSCGNEAVTTMGEYLRFFADDDATGSVTLFIEGFRDPAGFVEGARCLRQAGKPLAVLQAGRSKEATTAVAAHSGTLAGADEVVTGLLHQLGAIGVDDLDELIEVAEVFAHEQLPKGRRMFVVTDSGGEANLVTDHALALDLELPPPSPGMVKSLEARWPNFSYVGNPIDPWGVDPDYETLYEEILRRAVEEDVDIVAVALDKVTPWAGENEVDLGVAAARALLDATRGTDRLPVFFTMHAIGSAAEAVREPLRAARVPFLHGLRPSLIALRRTAWWRSWQPRKPAAATESGQNHMSRSGQMATSLASDEKGPILSEWASRKVLAAYGIPLVAAERAASADAAAAAAEGLGFPVVVKADVPGVAHKAASGLVRLGVASPEAVRLAFVELTNRALRDGFLAHGVLVESTATGIEAIAGMRHDPLFGPVVLLGVGGAMAEVVRDVAVRVCPPAAADLLEMPEECALGRMLGAAGIDPSPMLEVVGALARLALDHLEIVEIDLNPLFVGADGVMAADALVVLEER